MRLTPIFENGLEIEEPQAMSDKHWRALIDGRLFAEAITRAGLLGAIEQRCDDIKWEVQQYRNWLTKGEEPKSS